jgi:hypothetical protein
MTKAKSASWQVKSAFAFHVILINVPIAWTPSNWKGASGPGGGTRAHGQRLGGAFLSQQRSSLACKFRLTSGPESELAPPTLFSISAYRLSSDHTMLNQRAASALHSHHG